MDWEGPVQGGVVHGTNQVDFQVPWHIKAVTYTNDAPFPRLRSTSTTAPSPTDCSVAGISVNDSNVNNDWTASGFTCMSSGFNPRP